MRPPKAMGGAPMALIGVGGIATCMGACACACAWACGCGCESECECTRECAGASAGRGRASSLSVAHRRGRADRRPSILRAPRVAGICGAYLLTCAGLRRSFPVALAPRRAVPSPRATLIVASPCRTGRRAHRACAAPPSRRAASPAGQRWRSRRAGMATGWCGAVSWAGAVMN